MSKKSRVWEIKKTSSLGPSVCTNILFVYFFLDATRPPGSMALKKLTNDAYLFYQQAEAFNRSAATEEEIVLAGKKALLCVCTIANRLLKALRHYDALDFVSKLRQEQALYSPKAFHQRRQLSRITARERTSKYSSRKEYRSSLKTGDRNCN